MDKVHGVYTALVTAIKNDRVDHAAMEKLIDYVIDNGNHGLVILGGTGEYNALTNAQKIEAVEVTVKAAKGRVPVIAGIIGPGLPEVVEIGNKCKEAGADALMVVTPYYVISTQQGLIDYYQAVMKNVKMPLVLYNIPYRTMVNMLPETVEKLLDSDKDKQIVAMKECCPNMGQVMELLSRVRDRISVLSGEEFMFFQEISCGMKGGILATSNIVPDAWTEVFEKIESGDHKRAADIVLHLTPLLRLVFSESNPGPLKECMKQNGQDCGDPILPLIHTTPEIANGLKAEMKKFRDWYGK